MRIGLMGLSDKRHIIYTLIRVLGGLGRTIVFTPNLQYLMLSPEHQVEYEISDVSVVVFNCDVDDLDDEYETALYDFVIFDVQKDMPASLDVGLIMDCHDHYAYDLEDRDLDGIDLYTSCKVPKESMLVNEKFIRIPPASYIEPVLQQMFEQSVILPINHAGFIGSMSKLVSSLTDVSAVQITNRLKKGEMRV